MASSAAASTASLAILLAVFSVLRLMDASMAGFSDLFQPNWAVDHLDYDGEILRFKLDSTSGTGIISKSKYLFGKVAAEMKLAGGDSAGTVTAFYMSSGGDEHNEFDFEFLGNSSGEPYLMQTNVYVSGEGKREERMGLWFDPTKEFHRYAVVWSRRNVVFMVDETPVRVHKNDGNNNTVAGGGWEMAMDVQSSIWNADDWATQGGRVKTNWSNAPFVASMRGLKVEACEWRTGETEEENRRRCGGGGGGGGSSGGGVVEPSVEEQLSVHQRHQMGWARRKFMVYSYCEDKSRFPVIPTECIHHSHRQ